jgi:hypothetical protein
LLAQLPAHWVIENRLRDARDVAFDEDRSAVRTKAAPQVCAASGSPTSPPPATR